MEILERNRFQLIRQLPVGQAALRALVPDPRSPGWPRRARAGARDPGTANATCSATRPPSE